MDITAHIGDLTACTEATIVNTVAMIACALVAIACTETTNDHIAAETVHIEAAVHARSDYSKKMIFRTYYTGH